MSAPVTPGVSAVEQYARQLVGRPSGARVLALRADPAWSGPANIDVDGVKVRVRGCPSALAAYQALLESGSEYLILLTDQSADHLGASLTARFVMQRVQIVDPWNAVAAMFAAASVAADVRAGGPDVATTLADHRPVNGYPAAATGVVTADLAFRALLARVLDLSREGLDLAGLLDASTDLEACARWQTVPSTVRAVVEAWSATGISHIAPVVLEIMASGRAVGAVTIGLVCDVLAAAGADPEAAAVRVRLEPFLGGRCLALPQARDLADAAIAYVLALPAGDTRRSQHASRAEQLLRDLQWPSGANLSAMLPAGYSERLRNLAAAVTAASDGGASGMENALVRLRGHDSADRINAAAMGRAVMAVRLVRWLTTPDAPATCLRQALQRQLNQDAWVDWALADVWTGSSDPTVSAAYRRVADRVSARRREHDRQFAKLLGEAVAADRLTDAGIRVSEALSRLVAPLASEQPVLLVVADGMSGAVAAELADGMTSLGWEEFVRDGSRLPVIAALPTLTRYSRTSLLTGSPRDGGQADEKSAFKAQLGGPLFHKDDLRAAAGEELPAAVRDAISSDSPVVGVVLNTVDDTLAAQDPGGIDWTIESITHLGPLLDAAVQAGRAVVLTSDHGHVVERGSTRPDVGQSDQRFRTANSEPADGEVLLAGPAVMTPGGRVVAAWDESLRYRSKAAGYHGGASAAEVTIPFLVFARSLGESVGPGWERAADQAPDWWTTPAATPTTPTRPTAAARRSRRARPKGSESGSPDRTRTADPPTLFAPPPEPAEPAAPAPTRGQIVAAEVLASEVYAQQSRRTARGGPSDQIVAAVLRFLADHGGRGTQVQVARAAGLPGHRAVGLVAALQRVLNVEGYPVVGLDPDGLTVLLDERLLSEQFEVRL